LWGVGGVGEGDREGEGVKGKAFCISYTSLPFPNT
jgi:hypothetical protein